MKTFPVIFLSFILLGGTGILKGQTAVGGGQTTAAQNLPAPTPYAITTQDGNSSVWERTVYELAPDGTAVPKKHSYTELATGLNYLKNGQWTASKEEIDVLPQGGASATQGQHQAYFPGDIYQGQIELVTPDGKQMQSRPAALSYFDGTNTVLIATLTNSTGVLVSPNQVIYTNAFVGVDADLLYTYTRAGFEQDVVLRAQPPAPESFGLVSLNTRLQLLTEFFSAPQPNVTASVAGSLPDQNLDFGVMKMVPGRAFLMGTNSPSVPVGKQWMQYEGRQFLVEEIPVARVAAELDSLPMPAAQVTSRTSFQMASKQLVLPPQRSVKADTGPVLVAKTLLPAKGFMLDYQTINGSLTNYTFQGDTTYYISGTVNLTGTNTFEGGTVLKYTNGASLNIDNTCSINWMGAPYRPVILTAIDDNSVGDTISGSTGNPTNYYASPALSFANAGSFIFSNFRIMYANEAFDNFETSLTLYDGQFVNDKMGIEGAFSEYALRNVLMANVSNNISESYGTIDVQNSTFGGSAWLIGNFYSSSMSFENCIFANVTNLISGSPSALMGTNNGCYKAIEFGTGAVTNIFYPFQTVGAGSYYLTNGCAFTNSGITSIDPTLLASLKQETTWPPILYSNITITTNLTLSPQARRDTNAAPDLGYHYDPLDYLVDNYAFTNATLTMTNGVVVASYNDTGLLVEDGSSIVSIGSPVYPNWFVRYQSAQEQPVSLGMYGANPGSAYDVNPYHVSVAPNGEYLFTKFACPAGGGQHLYHYESNWSYANLLVEDCEFWGGENYFGGETNTVAVLMNNLFWRSVFSATPLYSTSTSYLFVTNNLFWGISSVQFGLNRRSAASTNWSIFNNDFDSCSSVGGTIVSITNGYNAYLNCTGYLYPTNGTDIFLTNALAYQTGPLGTFYQPTNSPLIYMGSTNANLLGLYHYTVSTNLIGGLEVPEGTNIVSIGYHYVATDAYGNPLDSNGDGIPDYLEDANGDGIFDTGDLADWQVSPFGLGGTNALQVFTPLK